jgi:NitT/TauT family transport system substrate-binding protein
VGHGLREQIAQYCDELQLVGMMADGEDSTALAHAYTLNVLHE